MNVAVSKRGVFFIISTISAYLHITQINATWYNRAYEVLVGNYDIYLCLKYIKPIHHTLQNNEKTIIKYNYIFY